MDDKALGELGEKLACEYLVQKGFKILARNYRISFGEIDVIARKKWSLFRKNDKTIHFVEVKTVAGPGNGFYGEDRVNYKKQRKLAQLATLWLTKQKLPLNYPHQIDVVAVSTLSDSTKMTQIEYFENVVEGL